MDLDFSFEMPTSLQSNVKNVTCHLILWNNVIEGKDGLTSRVIKIKAELLLCETFIKKTL